MAMITNRLRNLLSFQPLAAQQEETPEVVLSGFERISQLNSNWCWAAVTLSVKKLLTGAVGKTQCDLAKAQFQTCTDCGQGICNQRVQTLKPVLENEGLPNERTTGLSFADVQREIGSRGKPLILEMSTPEMRGLKHAVIVFGFKEEGGTKLVDASDPDSDGQFEGIIPFDRFAADCRAKYILQ